ncbi:MotA/TolQ/ExbB proton channel family protein [Pontibacter burrus]|uniref:MotA/TolQ/ExbB proton channel family protein n=1 Tax=Pontibacter burrus TaxID=2704466 RepID=A0A6B3LRH3_9BACT|nr:MotA/TolQ/ExbB proton channel family protein [Pontibacter burrus]NEM98433.1 MotA/TolQ/ExbB proton channel family protein [Pontibacter burrus]
MYSIISAVLLTVQRPLLLQASAPASVEFSLLSMLQKGGLIMIPLALLSLLSVYLFVERFLYIRSAGKTDNRLLESISDNLTKYNVDGALTICKLSTTPTARILEKGISRIGAPMRDLESAMETMARVEITHMEKNLGILGAIATIAPMLGFLGTVTGMIRTFFNISLYKNISIDIIAAGIYEKMITSATGLVVGITAYILYTILNNMLERSVSKMEMTSLNFLDILCKSNSYELQAN